MKKILFLILGLILILPILASGQTYLYSDTLRLGVPTYDTTTYPSLVNADSVVFYRINYSGTFQRLGVSTVDTVLSGVYSYKVAACSASSATYVGYYGAVAKVYKGGKRGAKTWNWKAVNGLTINLDNAIGTLSNSQVDDDVDVNVKTVTNTTWELRGLHLRGTTGADTAFIARGYGYGFGLFISGGTTGADAIYALGGGTGAGLHVKGGSGDGAEGIFAEGTGSGAGTYSLGGSSAPGLQVIGQGSGAGIRADGGSSGNGITATGFATGSGLRAIKGSTGYDIYADRQGNLSGSVNSVTSGVTVTTNNDKTGYTASTVSDKTGYSLASGTQTFNLTGNITGNLSGSVGSLINWDSLNAYRQSAKAIHDSTFTKEELVYAIYSEDTTSWVDTTNRMGQKIAKITYGAGGGATVSEIWHYAIDTTAVSVGTGSYLHQIRDLVNSYLDATISSRGTSNLVVTDNIGVNFSDVSGTLDSSEFSQYFLTSWHLRQPWSILTTSDNIGINLDDASGTLDSAQFSQYFLTSWHLRQPWSTLTASDNIGINWGDISNPTTTVGLTGTTISTSQGIASVSGAVGSVTGAVGSVTGAVGSVTGNVGGSVASVTGAVGSVIGAVGSVTNAVNINSNTDITAIKGKTDKMRFYTSGDTAIVSYGINATGTAPTVAEIATGIFHYVLDTTDVSAGAGSYIHQIRDLVNNYLDASITSRQATVTFPTNFSSLAITTGGKVDLNLAYLDTALDNGGGTDTSFVGFLRAGIGLVGDSIRAVGYVWNLNWAGLFGDSANNYLINTRFEKVDTTGYLLTGAGAGASAVEIADTLLGRGYFYGASWKVCSLLVLDGSNNPVSNLALTVKNFAGTGSPLGIRITNTLGKASFFLDTTSYRIYSYNPAYPQVNTYDTFAVSSTKTFDTVRVTAYSPGIPTSPDLCRVYNWIYKFTGVTDSGAIVQMRIKTVPLKYGSQLINGYARRDTTDANGYFFMDVFPNSLLKPDSTHYELIIYKTDGTIWKDTSITVPDENCWQIIW